MCSALSAPPNHIPAGFWTEWDTLGDLISNQMLHHLPGIDHITFGKCPNWFLLLLSSYKVSRYGQEKRLELHYFILGTVVMQLQI